MVDTPKLVVIEVRRAGRRPRYHRGTQVGRDLSMADERCNTDQAGLGREVLAKLPVLRRPWSQLCLRCWAGTTELRQAQAYHADRVRAAAQAALAGPPAQ